MVMLLKAEVFLNPLSIPDEESGPPTLCLGSLA